MFLSKLRNITSRNIFFSSFHNNSTKSIPAGNSERVIIEAGKRDLPQSPWKINLIARLIRGTWLPDALAQLKFSAKHRSDDIAKLVQRASHMAKLTHDAIPEELLVREVLVTKGMMQKRSRIMGRGRTGMGYKRWAHVMVRVEKVDFAREITEARNPIQLKRWQSLKYIVDAKKKKLASQRFETVQSPEAVQTPSAA